MHWRRAGLVNSPSLHLKAPAKINLGLGVLAKRGDGFHEIDTLMVRLALHDVVTLEPTMGDISLITNDSGLPVDDGNLAVRAARFYLEAAGAKAGVKIALEKRVPVAAGLGGGASDAAAVLLGLAELHPGRVNLFNLARNLGSDVPFFLLKKAAARARGRGEKLEPVDLPTRALVLVNPGLKIRASDAYAALQSFTPRLRVKRIVSGLEGREPLRYFNGLQAGVTLAHRSVREVLVALRNAGLQGVLMSGSGATCFGLAADRNHAQEVASSLHNTFPSWWVKVTTFA